MRAICSGDLDGPWHNVARPPIEPRPDKWDCWHLSAGPIIGEGTKRPTMFYNGATQDAAWRIGWAAFDESLTKLVDRCEEPPLARWWTVRVPLLWSLHLGYAWLP